MSEKAEHTEKPEDGAAMSVPCQDTLFTTMVVGSLPRPRWVQGVIADRLAGRLSEPEADEFLDAAVVSAILMQERAGLDYISDGEYRRENYTRVFADRVGGFRREQARRGPLLLHAFVVDELQPRGPIVSHEAEFLRRHTDRKIIVALPAPCTIGDLLWHPQHSAPVYPTRESFVRACVPILRDEIRVLSQLGVDAIQLDEPLLPRLAHPETYGLEADRASLEGAVALSAQTINEVTTGFGDIFTSVHLCHAHGARDAAIPHARDLIMGGVRSMRADRFAMEFNSPLAQALQSLEGFPEDKLLGLGVIAPGDHQVETPEIVVQRVEAAMQFVGKERLTLNPDCGFATTASNGANLDRAFLKLSAMCEGARRLRDTHQ